MKAFERIFLYTALAILFFYVFLVDGNVESQVAIQEKIVAKNIIVVDDEENEVLQISSIDEGGRIIINDKDGSEVIVMRASDEGGGIVATLARDGASGTLMYSEDLSGGKILVYNNNWCERVKIGQTENGHGGIWVYDRYGEYPAFYGHKR